LKTLLRNISGGVGQFTVHRFRRFQVFGYWSARAAISLVAKFVRDRQGLHRIFYAGGIFHSLHRLYRIERSGQGFGPIPAQVVARQLEMLIAPGPDKCAQLETLVAEQVEQEVLAPRSGFLLASRSVAVRVSVCSPCG